MKRWFIEVTCTGNESNPQFSWLCDKENFGKGKEYGYSTERNAISALTAYLNHDVQEKYWDNTYKVISMEV